MSHRDSADRNASYEIDLQGFSLSSRCVSCRRRHELGINRIGDGCPQNLVDRCVRIGVNIPVVGARHSLQFSRMTRAPQRRSDSGLVQRTARSKCAILNSLPRWFRYGIARSGAAGPIGLFALPCFRPERGCLVIALTFTVRAR